MKNKSDGNEKKPRAKLVVAHCGPWGEPGTVATTGPAVAGFVDGREFSTVAPDRDEGEISRLITAILDEVNETLGDAGRLEEDLADVLLPVGDGDCPCEDPEKGPQTRVGGHLLSVLHTVKNLRDTINGLRKRLAI